MRESTPIHCRKSAYRAFERAVARLETTDGLLHAAIAVSMHELEDVDPSVVFEVVGSLADDVCKRVHNKSPDALVAHLHEVLFNEFGFSGNTEDYYSTANSYLPEVILTRRGLPITLALVYKAVAERIGLTVCGINAPGHFMAAVQVNGTKMIVDPFAGGRTLSQREAEERIEETLGESIPEGENVLSEATNRQWIARIIRNLDAVFGHTERLADQAAMRELAALLPGNSNNGRRSDHD